MTHKTLLKLCCGFGGALLLLCGPLGTAGAGRDLAAIHNVFTEPVKLDKSTDTTMHVFFQHSLHKGIPCAECHHMIMSGEAYQSCSAGTDCHPILGKSTEPQSRFQAFHSSENERSCYTCHVVKRARGDTEKVCASCHPTLKAS